MINTSTFSNINNTEVLQHTNNRLLTYEITMTSRKRPLAEISQPHSTPARYAPSTPHTLRAMQQRSGAKQRSARSARHAMNKTNDIVRPDGSARNILKQFAKITAPLTKKRISTPIHVRQEDKENVDPSENEEDSILLKKPIFAIEDSIEEEDSELPAAPTPSVLPDDEDVDDPTLTFQNLAQIRDRRSGSERIDRRKSLASMLSQGEQDGDSDDEHEQEGDATIMTERGRRAISEEATGRFSRYSFGSIRMSDFGTELEVRRESDHQKKTVGMNDTSYIQNVVDDADDLGGETEVLRSLQQSAERPLEDDDSIQIPGLGDDTFNLQMPDDDLQEEPTPVQTHANAQTHKDSLFIPLDATPGPEPIAGTPGSADEDLSRPSGVSTSRRQTLLETVTTATQANRRKKLKMTHQGTMVPSLPSSLVKWVATESQTRAGMRKPKLGRDHMKALEQATEWYFEQVGGDLAAYSSHGRRKKRVDTDDVLLLMRRQKVLSNPGELRSLAKDWLPSDVWNGLELPDLP